MTKGQISSAPNLTCLHILFLLYNAEWCTMYRHYHLTKSFQIQPLQKFCQAHRGKNTHLVYQ